MRRIWCITCDSFVHKEGCEYCDSMLSGLQILEAWELHGEKLTRLKELVDTMIIKFYLEWRRARE